MKSEYRTVLVQEGDVLRYIEQLERDGWRIESAMVVLVRVAPKAEPPAEVPQWRGDKHGCHTPIIDKAGDEDRWYDVNAI